MVLFYYSSCWKKKEVRNGSGRIIFTRLSIVMIVMYLDFLNFEDIEKIFLFCCYGSGGPKLPMSPWPQFEKKEGYLGSDATSWVESIFVVKLGDIRSALPHDRSCLPACLLADAHRGCAHVIHAAVI